MTGTTEEKIDFCLSKCGDGYCNAMKGKGGYPCIQYVCEFCDHRDDKDYCWFCQTDRSVEMRTMAELKRNSNIRKEVFALEAAICSGLDTNYESSAGDIAFVRRRFKDFRRMVGWDKK